MVSSEQPGASLAFSKSLRIRKKTSAYPQSAIGLKMYSDYMLYSNSFYLVSKPIPSIRVKLANI